jgi:hypothetical protein
MPSELSKPLDLDLKHGRTSGLKYCQQPNDCNIDEGTNLCSYIQHRAQWPLGWMLCMIVVIDAGVSDVNAASKFWVESEGRLSFRVSPKHRKHQEWCLLGCYAVWLL